VPVKSGANFAGWAIDANGDTEINPESEIYNPGETVTLTNLSATTNVVATAQWEE
jgi:hypothetical protein